MSSPSSRPDATSLKKTESLLAKNKSQQSAADNQISTLSKKMAELKKSSEEKKQKADEILSSIPEEQRESNPEALKAIEIKKEAEKEEILARMMEQQIQQTEKQKELLREEEQLLTQKKEILSAVVNNPSSYTQEKENQLSELDKKLTAVSESQTPITNAYSPQLKNTEEQIALTEKEIRTLERSIADKEAEISDMEEQLQNTKKKKQKEELKKNIASAIQEVQRLKEQKKSKEEELASLKTEQENQKLALKEVQKILESVPPTAVQNENTQDVSASASPVPLKEIEKSYSSSIQPYDPQNPDAYLDASEKIIDYNKKLDASILAYNNMLNAEKNPQKAKAIRNEITQLENRKKQNIRLLEEYAKKREVLILENKMLLTQTPPSVPVLNESDARDNEKLKKIEEITTKDQQYFSQYVTTSENSVQNKESKSAFEELNKQKEVLVTLSRELQNLNASASGASSAELQKKAEQVMQQADSIRKEAQNKPDNERVTLIQKANQLEKEYLNLQVQAYETKSVENEKRSVLLQNDYQQLLNATQDENKKQQWQQRMEEIKNTQRQFQEILRESKNTPNPSAKLGNLENALEKQQIALEKQEQLIQEMHRENPQIVLSSDKQNSGQNITEEKINQLKKESERYNSLKENLLSTLNDNNQKTINRLTSGLNLNPPPDASANEKQLAAKIKNNLDKLNADNTSSGTSSADKNASLQNKVAIQNEILQDIKTLSTLQKARKEQENAAALLAAASNNPRPARENNPASSRNTPQDNTLASNIPAANRNNTQPATQRENNTRPENTANANNRTDMFSTKEVIYSVELSLKNNKDTSVSSLQSFISSNNPPLQNPEAENRKNTALDNLRYLQKEIEQAYQSGNTSNENTNTTTVTEQQIQQKVSQLDQEAENISSEIDQLRNSSSADKSLLSAKEQQLNSLKAESATLKMQLFSANDKAFMDAIQQGMDKLKSQNHSSLPDATALMDKINNLKKQSRQIREEAESLSGAARWGSLGNAEELEAEVLQNEKKLLDMLQGIYPELSYQPPKFTNISSSSAPDENQKKIIRQKQTQQVSELISLVNAYILNFESYKPDTRRMSDAQKQQWLELIKRRNLIQELARKANAENNPENKIRWLSTAVKESVVMTQQLNTFQTSTPNVAARTNTTSNDNINTRERETTIPVARNTNNAPSNVNNPARERNVNNPTRERETNVPVAGNNTNRENTVANTNRITNRNNENTQPASENTAAGTQKLFVTDGMEIYNRNAYSDAKPIPINEPPPPGLIFRVQLGVFKNRLPNNAFRGLTPVSGETTSDGSVKYTAGNFRRFEVAAGVKKELNRNGYPDAFVVAYYNGKRISLAEAMQLMENEGKQPDIAQADNIRINADVRPIVPIVPANPTEEPATDLVVVSGELEKIKKLLYTVQIGVYSRQISKSRLKNLEPIYTEKLPGGLYRYTAGIYNIDTKVIADKNRVIALGITDAFVSAYLEGKRVNFNEIRQRISKGETFAFENENPIRFPSGAPSVPVATEENASTPPPDVIPYKNNVTQYPEATPENGIKNTEEGICFKVQIGAYSRQVPQDVAERFNKISTWPVEYKYINQLFIYNVGNFADKANAQKLRQEIINLGIPDAFITVYKDGKKLFGEEARSYLSGN